MTAKIFCLISSQTSADSFKKKKTIPYLVYQWCKKHFKFFKSTSKVFFNIKKKKSISIDLKEIKKINKRNLLKMKLGKRKEKKKKLTSFELIIFMSSQNDLMCKVEVV